MSSEFNLMPLPGSGLQRPNDTGGERGVFGPGSGGPKEVTYVTQARLGPGGCGHAANSATPRQHRAPTAADAGRVTSQATTMEPATPQRTADARRMAPAPTTEPITVCVVDTGT